jgi:hypothetical protein
MPDRYVTTESSDGGAGSAIGASALIQTIVWSVVVLVLLVIGILLLLHYHVL